MYCIVFFIFLLFNLICVLFLHIQNKLETNFGGKQWFEAPMRISILYKKLNKNPTYIGFTTQILIQIIRKYEYDNTKCTLFEELSNYLHVEILSIKNKSKFAIEMSILN